MLELVGGIISIVVGIIMQIIGGAIINTVTAQGGIGDCASQDYNGDGVIGFSGKTTNSTGSVVTTTIHDINNDDQLTQAYKQCNSTRNNGYTILNIISVMMIIGGVIVAIRGVQA